MEKQIVATIDSHVFEIEESEFNRIFDELEKTLAANGMHWDDSPFGSILHLCDAADVEAIKNGSMDEKHYWTKKILTDEYHNHHKKFDLENYIKRSLNKPYRITEKPQTAKERLEEKRAWENMWK